MKAIILAAGVGSRMGAITRDFPKCLLEVQGGSILDTQVRAFRENDIEEIHIVLGHKAELVREVAEPLGLICWKNERYASTGMLESLYSAWDALEGDVIVSYGDTFLRPRVVGELVNSDAQLGLAAAPWIGQEAERVESAFQGEVELGLRKGSTKVLCRGNVVKRISKDIQSEPQCEVLEYIGVFKSSGESTSLLRQKVSSAVEQKLTAAAPSPSYLFSDLLKEGFLLTAVRIAADDYAECDYPEDWEQAKTTFCL